MNQYPIPPTVFISRELKEDSPFRIRLEAMGANVAGQSLIEFTPVGFGEVPPCEWIFFYSKKAARFFFKGLETSIPARVKWAALGRGTAAALSARGIPPSFIGTGDPEEVAAAFAKEAAGQRVLFPQARQSRQSIQQMLKGKIQSITLVVYDNRPCDVIDIPFCKVLTFTSPMNANAYFSKQALRKGQKVVAIGHTTAAALHQLGIEQVTVAEEPSETGLAGAVAALLHKN